MLQKPHFQTGFVKIVLTFFVLRKTDFVAVFVGAQANGALVIWIIFMVRIVGFVFLDQKTCFALEATIFGLGLFVCQPNVLLSYNVGKKKIILILCDANK